MASRTNSESGTDLADARRAHQRIGVQDFQGGADVARVGVAEATTVRLCRDRRGSRLAQV
jgi:hypothetical protein